MRSAHQPSPEAVARVRALAERRLSGDEFRTAMATPLDDAELEEARSLIRWFRRRYPTPAARSAYVRRAYERWVRTTTGTESRPSR